MAEKNFFESTYDKISDFVQPNKVEADASFKDTSNKAIENGIITKEELDALMTRFDNDKNNLWEETKEQLDNLKKESITWMLKNGFDIRNSNDITNLNKFIYWTDFKLDKTLKTKLDTIKAFYDKADKTMLENARDLVGYDNLTLTINEKNEIVEMGILDFNNPFNDNEAKINKNEYGLDWAEKINKEAVLKETKKQELLSRVNSSIDDFEKKKSEELDVLRKNLQSDLDELKKLWTDTKYIEARLTALEPKKAESSTNTEETKKDEKKLEKKKSSLDKAKEYHSKYTKEQISNIQMVLEIKQDWVFWTKTFAAVEDFQRKNKLKVDGMVWPKTQAKMWFYL